MKKSNSFIAKIALLGAIAAFSLAALGCEKKAPDFIPKSEYGKEAVVHFDDMADQPKYIKVKKSEFDKKKAIMDRRVSREKSRGIYRQDNRWGH